MKRRVEEMEAEAAKLRQMQASLDQQQEGLREKFSSKMTGGREAVLENVDMADKALAALKNGEPLSTVVHQEEEHRKSEARRRKSTQRSSSDEHGAIAGDSNQKKGKRQDGSEDENLFEDISNVEENGSSSQ